MRSGPSSAERARRLIAILGRLTAGSRIPLDELAGELGATPAELAGDLETLSLCGVAPYGPDQLADVFVEDGYVEVYTALPALNEPVRLAPREAEALVAALGAAGFSADDELTRKLVRAASAAFDAEELERTLRTTTATHDSAVFETLAAAARDHLVARIAYQADGADVAGERDVEPLALFAERGAWYLSAWCRLAGGERTFRVDRVRGALVTGEAFDPAEHGARDARHSALPAEGLPTARLRFEPGEPFVAREWPGGTIAQTDPDGATIAEVPYASTAWVARRVVARLGRVRVLEPAEMREAVAATARRELDAL